AHNAQFVVSGGNVTIVPSRPGRDVDRSQLEQAITEAALGNHVARVELGPRAPDLTTAKARALGIREKLVSFTTDMGVSSSNRILDPSPYPLGRDATVSWGGPDFQFKNDMKHGILIKTSYTDSTLTFTFYGTSEHRRVVAHTGTQTNWTTPGMNYAVDPNAPR